MARSLVLLALGVAIGCGGVTAFSAGEETSMPAETGPWAEQRGATFVSSAQHFLPPAGAFVEAHSLGPGCHIFMVVAAPGVRDADLAVWTADGERLVYDEAPDARPVVQICGARRVFVRVSAPAGAGLTSLHHYRAEDAVSLAGLGDGAATYEEAERTESERALEARGFRRQRTWTLEAPGPAVDIALGAGTGCFTLVVRGDSLERVIVRSAPDEEEVRAQASPAMLQWCIEDARAQRVTIESSDASALDVELYRATRERIAGESDLWLGDRSRSEL